MKKDPKVSIIIPLYDVKPRFFNDLAKYKKLEYPRYEIIIVCDKNTSIPPSIAKVIVTGEERTGPAEKRDLAIKYAKGEICAFIDDDAYPDPKWLNKCTLDFTDKSIAAVGGPGLTPKEDGYMENLTGLTLSSFFCGGFAQFRFIKGEKKFVTDYPAYNLLIRTKVLKKVGGYGSYFYGGEDTFLCLKLIKLGYKILYDPEVVVYHHRRPLFTQYLAQIANVGKHRGYFAKKFPETSRQIGYFIPSIISLVFIIMFILSFFDYKIAFFFISLLVFFLLLGSVSVLKQGGIIKSFIVSLAIILTHLTYGIFFIKGLLTKDLKR